MSRMLRLAAGVVCVLALAAALPGLAGAQARPRDRRAPSPSRPPAVVVRGHVFIGGYFYDPFFGPYPWWHRTAYPFGYYPMYDSRAEVRLMVKPVETAVYVDGFYAGIADDFDGVFQSLPLPPGGHEITLYLAGYRTVRHSLYLTPASHLNLRDQMAPLPPGGVSEPPRLAPPVPPPPSGSYRGPATAPPVPPFAPPVSSVNAGPAAGFGTLVLQVQPPNAEVYVDGQRWMTSGEGHFALQLTEGPHHIELRLPGYRSFSTDIEMRTGQTVPLNVGLSFEKS